MGGTGLRCLNDLPAFRTGSDIPAQATAGLRRRLCDAGRYEWDGIHIMHNKTMSC